MSKSKSTMSAISTQLPLFSEYTDPAPQVKVPLPVIAATKFGFELPYIVGNDSKTYFRLRSWLAGCIGDKSAVKVIQNLRATTYFSKVAGQFILNPEMSGSGYDQDFEYVLDGVLYGITQDLRSTKARPVVQSIKDYLRDAGVKMDEFRLAPEKAFDAGTKGMLAQGVSPSKIKARADGIIARNEMTTTAKITNKNHNPNYGALTSYEYQNLFGRGKSAIAAELGLTKSQTEHEFRDHIDELALKAIEAAELTASRKMQQVGRLLTDEEQIEIVVHSARIAAKSFKEMADYVGRDLATGRPLLKGKN